MKFRTINNHIQSKDIKGSLNAKNNQDQIALKNNCKQKRLIVIGNVLQAEIDISTYKIGQTIPKT